MKWPGMSDNTGGPAQGTRSRVSSEKGSKLKKHSKLDTVTEGKSQKLVSQYFVKECVSDAHVDYNDGSLILKKRSTSGNLYHSSLIINANKLATAGMLNNSVCISDSQLAMLMSADALVTEREVSSSGECNVNMRNNLETWIPLQRGDQMVSSAINTTDSICLPATHTTNTITSTNATMSTDTSIIVGSGVNARGSNVSTCIKGSDHGGGDHISSNMQEATNLLVPPPGTTDPTLLMLYTMNTTLTTIQKDIKELKSSKTELGRQLDSIIFDQEEDHEMLQTVQSDLQCNQDTVELLTSIVVRQEGQINELK